MRNRPARNSRMPSLAKVKADLAAGVTPTQMIDRYKVGHSTVSCFLTKHGLTRNRKAKLPPDEEVVACLQERMSLEKLAERFGISKDTIRRQIEERGLRKLVPPPPPAAIAPVHAGPQPSPIKHIVTALDGSKISVPRIPTIHGRFEVRS